jgi:hydrogenase 3 maturation protease
MVADLEARLAELAGRKLAVVCVGNALRGDEGFGPAVAARLESDAVFRAGMEAAAVLGAVAERGPEAVVFVDAAELGAEPGTLRLLTAEEVESGEGTPRSFSFGAAAERLGVLCFLLAVQPGNTAMGSVMTVDVVRSAQGAAKLLGPLLN